jgi:hypothetical protein
MGNGWERPLEAMCVIVGRYRRRGKAAQVVPAGRIEMRERYLHRSHG